MSESTEPPSAGSAGMEDAPTLLGPAEVSARRGSYRLVEVRPDGTRRETKLGE